VQGLSGIRAIACGTFHSFALRQDGTIVGWGDNRNGQLGDGTQISRRAPVPVENFSDIAAIASGSSILLALRRDGTVCTWGVESRTGSSPFLSSSRPVPECISTFSGVRAIAAGGGTGYALREDGTVWVWGASLCGAGGAFQSVLTSQPIMDRVEKISAGLSHVLLQRQDESVWYCGTINESFSSRRPEELRELSQVDAISSGSRHALAHSRSGIIWSWGENTHGQLGTGDRNSRSTIATVWDGTGELTRP